MSKQAEQLREGPATPDNRRINQNGGLVHPMWRKFRALPVSLRIVAMGVLVLAAYVLGTAFGNPNPTPGTSPLADVGGPAETALPEPDETPVAPLASPTPQDLVVTLPADVTRVIDGDTVEVRLVDGRAERVRLIGIDTPETGRPYAHKATAYTSERTAGKRVFLQSDVEHRDRYGRLLAYVWYVDPERGDEAEARAQMLNARMLVDGFAAQLTVPPNVRYAEMFTRFQREARAAERGLWEPVRQASTPMRRPTQPTHASSPSPSPMSGGSCHSSYEGVCVPIASDVDCPGGGGNGPEYAPSKDFRVVGPDVYGLDSDHDGTACESR